MLTLCSFRTFYDKYTLGGNTILVKEVQLENTSPDPEVVLVAPIIFTELGMTTDVSPVHPEKAL